MKKLFAMTLAAMLALPAVVFADANWYGSLRGNVEFKSGKDAAYGTGGSRWGIKGSNEVSEGLSAVYKFETRLGEGAGSQDTNQIYVGLSGGFGNVTLGKVPSAAYNYSGAMRDINNVYGGSDVGSSRSNGLSYSLDTGAAAFQFDAIMDGGKDTGQSVDQFSFGASLDLGDIGKLGFAYEEVENETVMETMTEYSSVSKSTTMIDGKVTTTITGDVNTVVNGKINTNVTIGDINSIINGTLSGKITDAKIQGDVLASVMISGYTDPVAKFPQIPRGDCVLYTTPEDGETTRTEQPSPNTEAQCDALADDDTKRVVWTVDSNLSGEEDDTKDKEIADRTPKAGDDASIVVSGVEKISDVAEIKYFDADGDELKREVRWFRVSGALPTIPGSSSATDHEKCLARSSESTAVCEERIVYLDSDGKAGEVSTTSGSISLDGSTLSLADGTVEIIGPDGVTTTIAADQIDAISTHNLTAGSTHDIEAKSTHNLTAKTTTTTTTTAKEVSKEKTVYGHSAMHVSSQFDLGAVTLGLGYTEKESNDPKKKMDAKTTYLGLSGGLGDTGASWVMQARNKEDHAGKESSPWTVGVAQSLGDGARVYLEHENSDDGAGGATTAGLRVDF